jgi:predicted DNA binding CopG/RHH family protein
MATKEAQARANMKYQREKQKAITIRVTPEELERYKAKAEDAGLSFRAFIMQAMDSYNP